jgi:hypothetical protein
MLTWARKCIVAGLVVAAVWVPLTAGAGASVDGVTLQSCAGTADSAHKQFHQRRAGRPWDSWTRNACIKGMQTWLAATYIGTVHLGFGQLLSDDWKNVGYFPIDGKWGAKTSRALKGYFKFRNVFPTLTGRLAGHDVLMHMFRDCWAHGESSLNYKSPACY